MVAFTIGAIDWEGVEEGVDQCFSTKVQRHASVSWNVLGVLPSL